VQGFSAFLSQIRHTSVLSKEDELELTLFIQWGNRLRKLREDCSSTSAVAADLQHLSEISGLVTRYEFLVCSRFDKRMCSLSTTSHRQ